MDMNSLHNFKAHFHLSDGDGDEMEVIFDDRDEALEYLAIHVGLIEIEACNKDAAALLAVS
jgi:hypothetical protein